MKKRKINPVRLGFTIFTIMIMVSLLRWLQAPVGVQNGGITPQGVKWEWENISAPDATSPVIRLRAVKSSEGFSAVIYTNRWDNWTQQPWGKEFLQKTVDTCYVYNKAGTPEIIEQIILGNLIELNGKTFNN